MEGVNDMAVKKKAVRKKSKRRGRSAVATDNRPVAVTTFRLYRDQLVALQRRALDRRAEGLPGRADASSVLRELLDRELGTG